MCLFEYRSPVSTSRQLRRCADAGPACSKIWLMRRSSAASIGFGRYGPPVTRASDPNIDSLTMRAWSVDGALTAITIGVLQP